MLKFIFDAVRALLSLIDKIVYWFLSELISLFDSIASIQLFSDDVIKDFSSRIFIFIAIIMIFKVSFSIIQYIINPDNFGDKEKGFSKVIQNVLLTLVCLVFVGKIFEFAYDLQKKVLNEQVIPSIILGIEDVDNTKQGEVKDQLPFLIISAFFTPNSELVEIEYSRSENDYRCKGINMHSGTTYNTGFGTCLDTIAEDAFDPSKYNTSIDTNNYWNLLDNATIHVRNSDLYVFDYKFIISTVAGIFMVIIYINFCIDLAIRAAKLGFLQLISPIPIISMIDPKSSKSGMMSKWVKQCLSTYLGLFIRVAAVNFVIYIIYIIMQPDFLKNIQGQSQNVFVQILIIFGALMFAKELPKLISDLTGIDLKGDFKLNPLKRIEEAPGGKLASRAITNTGKAAGSLAGHGLGAVGHLGMLGAYAGAGAIGGLISGRGAGAGALKETKMALNRARGSLIKGANGGLTNMAGIVGAKPKGIEDNTKTQNQEILKEYTGDRKAISEEKKREKELDESKKLYEQNTEVTESGAKKPKYDQLYKNADFRSAVKQMDDNKAKMYAAQNELDAIKREYETNPELAVLKADYEKYSSMGVGYEDQAAYIKSQIDDYQREYTIKYNAAVKDVGTTKKNYEIAQQEVENLGKRYVIDYKTYKSYNAASDYFGAFDGQVPNLSPASNSNASQPPELDSNQPLGSNSTSGGPTHVGEQENTGNSDDIL